MWKKGNSSASSPEMYISVMQVWDPLDFIERDDTVHIHDNFPQCTVLDWYVLRNVSDSCIHTDIHMFVFTVAHLLSTCNACTLPSVLTLKSENKILTLIFKNIYYALSWIKIHKEFNTYTLKGMYEKAWTLGVTDQLTHLRCKQINR